MASIRKLTSQTGWFAKLALLCTFAAISSGCGAAAPAASTASAVHDINSLTASLQAEGVTVVPGGAVHHPFLSIAGQVLLVNNQAVEVFQYPSASALLADTANITDDGCIGTIGGGEDNPWTGPPHFYKRAGVLVIFVGTDSNVLRALIAVMGPQFKGQ